MSQSNEKIYTVDYINSLPEDELDNKKEVYNSKLQTYGEVYTIPAKEKVLEMKEKLEKMSN